MPIFICRLQFLFARRQKCVSAPKAGARSLEDLPSANIVRTKAKVRVSPKGWRTVFGRFAECKYYSHEDKSAGQPQRLAHGL